MSTNTPLPQLSVRSASSHKGDYGRAMLIGGSVGMSGAITIAALGTLRSGAGLTTVAVPADIWPIVAAANPALMTMPLTADQRGRISKTDLAKLTRKAREMTAIAIGPGLGQSFDLQKMVEEMVHSLPKPLVVDADALNLLAKTQAWMQFHFAAPRILTPHPGEFERLLGVSAKSREAQIKAAKELSKIKHLVIVLKGPQTAICCEGEVVFNSTGNAKMAVGGSGDLLTGIILGLLCQGLSPRDAAVLGCHLHGLSGDLAAAKLHCPSVLPTDLLEALPHAFELIAH